MSSEASTRTLPPATTCTSPLIAARVVVSTTKALADPAMETPPEMAMPTPTAMLLARARAPTSTSPAVSTTVANVVPVWASVSNEPELPIQASVAPFRTGSAMAGATAATPAPLALPPTTMTS